MAESVIPSRRTNGGAGTTLRDFLRHADEVDGYVAVVRARVTAIAGPGGDTSENGGTTGTALPIGVVDLNEATFEQLRAVGLSTTQAARLIARRDRLGAFGSIRDLEEVPGLPEEILEALASRVRALRGTSHALPALPPVAGASF
jgi:hypothetical protein